MGRIWQYSSRMATDPTLGELLLRTSRVLLRRGSAGLSPFGLAPHQIRALHAIVAEGPLRLSALADLLKITPRSVTDVVDLLEARRLVLRNTDPTDRRAIMVSATSEGRRIESRIVQARAANADAYFACLEPADRDQLARILRTLEVAS